MVGPVETLLGRGGESVARLDAGPVTSDAGSVRSIPSVSSWLRLTDLGGPGAPFGFVRVAAARLECGGRDTFRLPGASCVNHAIDTTGIIVASFAPISGYREASLGSFAPPRLARLTGSTAIMAELGSFGGYGSRRSALGRGAGHGIAHGPETGSPASSHPSAVLSKIASNVIHQVLLWTMIEQRQASMGFFPLCSSRGGME